MKYDTLRPIIDEDPKGTFPFCLASYKRHSSLSKMTFKVSTIFKGL